MGNYLKRIALKGGLNQKRLNIELYTVDDIIEIDKEFYEELSELLHKMEPRSKIVTEIIKRVMEAYHNLWKGVKTEIGERKKVCRSLDGINIYNILSEKEIPRELYTLLLRIMIINDIAINVTDDLVDNLKRNPKREDLIGSLTYDVLMSHLVYRLIFDFLSKQKNVVKLLKFYGAINKAKDFMYQSLLILPIIPLEEKRVYEEIVSNKLSKEEIAEKLIKSYMTRGEDIKFFVYLPLTFANYRFTYEVLETAITFRALQLLYKDKKDLKWDIYHNTPNPLAPLYSINIDEKSREEIINTIEERLRYMLESRLENSSKKIGKERIEILRNYLYQRIREI